MNFDMSKYVPVELSEAQKKAYCEEFRGFAVNGDPLPDPADMVMSQVIYNPVTNHYRLEYQTEDFYPRDEFGYPRTDLIDYYLPGVTVRQPFSKASEHEKADNKRKRAEKKKKKKKRQATNLDEKVDKKRMKKTKKKKTKKIQDIRTGQIIGRGTERGGLYYVDEVSTSGNVMLAHGTSEREAWLWHRRLGHPSAKNLEEPKDNTSSPTRSKSIETLADNNLDPVLHPSASTASGTRFQPHMKQILGVMRRCDHCRPLLEDLVTSGTKPEAEGRSICEDLTESTCVENLDQSTAPVNN